MIDLDRHRSSNTDPEKQAFYVPVGIDYETDEAPYGDPQPHTLQRFAEGLEPGSSIIDIAGAPGRYAFPLAKDGHKVTIYDLDPRPLNVARKRAEQERLAGNISTMQGNLLDINALRQLGSQYDGMLIAGFLYLLEPFVVREIFKRSVSTLKPGGVAVVEFNTDITRLDKEGGTLKGAAEHNHTTAGGRLLLASMFQDAGFTGMQYEKTTAQYDKSFTYKATVTIASGVLNR